ncbi:hypothetical protein [Cyanobium gracile]|uniref:DUF3347 domain-containing protein n=1 Tax=Cyanobium gracile UHCC 0281 TaxID=3110309 RepID=A0ABU5SRH5_9CYAN|nr:hypothetical protein [Cyanobium gracile]MEA5441112.1 hypothetical protein [Cyanobium gracile UHCC 0281]
MPTPLRSIELFLALGAATTAIGALPADAAMAATGTHQAAPTHLVAQHGGHGGPIPAAASSEGGEGGEGGEGSQEIAASDTAYLAVLGQMRGHLIVAVELMQEGNVAQAEKHIGHPVEELYGSVEPDLERRRVKPFKESLTALLELIQASPGSSETRKAYQSAVAAIDAAMLGVPETVRRDPTTTAAVVREIVKVAASEYDASMADGAIVETIEYQDSRGFVLYAGELLTASLGPGTGPEAMALLVPIQRRLTALSKAWPSLKPPSRPVMDARTVTILASQL